LNDTTRPAGAGRTARIPPNAWHAYRRLLGYVRPHRGAFLLGMLGGAMYSTATASWGWFANIFAKRALTHPDPTAIVWVPLLLVGLFLLRGVGDFTQTYFMGYVGRQVVARLRREIFQQVLRLPIGFFDRSSSGALLSRLTFNTEQIGQATTDSVVIFGRSVLIILGAIGYLLSLNTRLALIALTMGPLVAWLVSIINRHFRRYSRRIQDSMGDVTRVAKESFEAPRLVKVYNAQEHLRAQFEAVNQHNRHSNMKQVLTKGLSNPTLQLLTASGAAMVLSIAIGDAVHGRMTSADLVAFFATLVVISSTLRELVNVAGPVQQGVAAGQNIFELLDEPTEIEGVGYVTSRVRGEVEFAQVSFAYASGKGAALHGVSLAAAAGENIAIVGRSGSGKSTLVNLLPRFYDVASGVVRIDGRDVRDYELVSLREQIAVVSQEVILFNDTIRNNIAFGRPVSAQALERAAEAAHVLEFVRELPQGLDTLVGDRGVLLSGGQRQRIAIARALLKDAPILILDEATSALDTEAERHIQAALTELVRNRTTFVIAHRLSTVESAHRIVVLDAGRIVELGTHAELLQHGGIYSQLHRLQFSD
jgi:subfamily B ATP-binding cassette protein MsbA